MTRGTFSFAHGLLLLVVMDTLAIIGAILARMYLGIDPLSAFHFLYYGAQFGLIVSTVVLLKSVFEMLTGRRVPWASSAAAIFLGLSPLLLSLLVVGKTGFAAPMIHDISTDMNDPPRFIRAGELRQPGENSLAYDSALLRPLQEQSYPEIKPIFVSLDREPVFAAVRKTAKDLGWTISYSDDETGHLEAFEETVVFGFADDIVVRVTANDPGSRIDLRSASRVGVGDLGVNAARIRRFTGAFPGNLEAVRNNSPLPWSPASPATPAGRAATDSSNHAG